MFTSEHIKALIRDPIEQDILSHILFLEENLKDCTRIRKQRSSSLPAREVLDHFLFLYQKKYRTAYSIKNKAGALARISNFMKCHKLDVVAYCSFLDKAFEYVFNDTFIPGIGHVCSSSILEMVENVRSGAVRPNFRELRNERKKQRK